MQKIMELKSSAAKPCFSTLGLKAIVVRSVAGKVIAL
jgi:hypothetical protein